MSVLPALDVASGAFITVGTGVQRIRGRLQKRNVFAGSEAYAQAEPAKGRVSLDISPECELEAELRAERVL